MSALTKASRGKPCSVRIPGFCNGNAETTVSAHVNGVRLGHGVGKKVNDLLAADCCSACHDLIDNRVRNNRFSRDELKLMHYEGVMETLLRRVDDGLVVSK